MRLASEKKILVADDEPDIRNFLATLLEDAEFNVETAADGVEALEKVKTFEPDLMILDMVMPRKSGILVMRTLRESERWKELPVILVTAHAHDEFGRDQIKQFNAFASGIRPRYTMEKPVTPSKLLNAICEILNVEILKKSRTDEMETVKSLISETNPETFKKIQKMLAGDK